MIKVLLLLPLLLLQSATFFNQNRAASSPGISFIAEAHSPTPTSGGTSGSATAINVSVNDKLIVFCETGGTANTLSVTDTIGNTFSPTTQQLSGAFGNSAIFYAVSSGANASDVVTCTSNTLAPYAGDVVLQYRGGATSSILDGQTGNSNNGVGSWLTSSFSTTVANEVIVQCMITDSGGATAGTIGGVTANLRVSLGANWYACQDLITTSTQTSITANFPFSFGDYMGNMAWFK